MLSPGTACQRTDGQSPDVQGQGLALFITPALLVWICFLLSMSKFHAAKKLQEGLQIGCCQQRKGHGMAEEKVETAGGQGVCSECGQTEFTWGRLLDSEGHQTKFHPDGPFFTLLSTNEQVRKCDTAGTCRCFPKGRHENQRQKWGQEEYPSSRPRFAATLAGHHI